MSAASLDRPSWIRPGALVSRRALRRLALSGLVAGVAVAGAVFGERWWTVGRFIESTDDAYVRTRAALEAARRQLDVIATEKDEVQAALAEAVADRDQAQLNVQYAEIRAPIDGWVGNRSAREGAYANVGDQLLALVPARGLWVDANFKENQLAKIRPGMRATVEADVLPGQVFEGRVASLAPATGAEFSVLPPENATGNFTKIVQRVPVRILLEGDAAKLGELRPGLSVTASVDERGDAGDAK